MLVRVPPVTGADQSDDAAGTMGIADMQHAPIDFAQQPPAQLPGSAVSMIEKNQGPWIGKGLLRYRKIDTMAREIRALLGGIPRETHDRRLRHGA